MTNNCGIDKSKFIFEDMIAREYEELVGEIRLDKQCKGLIYDDFEPLMLKYGFARPE